MKKVIKEEDGKVVLRVSLSRDEMNSNTGVVFTSAEAWNYLKEKGYNITFCVENKPVANIGLNANNEGKYVFLLKKAPKPVESVEKPKVVEEIEKPKKVQTNKRTTRSSRRTPKRKND